MADSGAHAAPQLRSCWSAGDDRRLAPKRRASEAGPHAGVPVHEARLEGEGRLALVLVQLHLIAVPLRNVPLELGLRGKHDKLLLAATLERAQEVLGLEMLLELAVRVEVVVPIRVLAAAEVAVVVLLLHVPVQLLRVVKVLAAEAARTRSP